MNETRIHSSRMRSTRPLTVVPVYMLVGGGGGGGGGVVQGGGGRCCPPTSRQDSPSDHVTYPMMHLVSHLPPPLPGVEQTDACQNITFARFATQAIMMQKVQQLLKQVNYVIEVRGGQGPGGVVPCYLSYGDPLHTEKMTY